MPFRRRDDCNILLAFHSIHAKIAFCRHESWRSRRCNCEQMTPTVHNDTDPLAPQREAAFFYGLFLRGHSLEAIRQDIDIPRPVIDKWLRAKDFQGAFRADLDRVYQYRKRVLAIFDGLVSSENSRFSIQ